MIKRVMSTGVGVWVTVLVAVLVVVSPVVPGMMVVADTSEDAGSHQPAVDALRALDVFDGTGCENSDGLCPNDPLKRWEMAVWLVRLLDVEEPSQMEESRFADIESDRWWAAHTGRLGELGVTRGCATGPLRYCPYASVTRGQMASFLVRAFRLEAASPAGFGDTAGSSHAANIDALAAARVTVGCSTDSLLYCPSRSVTRGEMATFLARAIGLIEAPPPKPPTFKAITAGGFHSCAVRTNGTIVCWGNNEDGQSNAPSGTFTAVTGGLGHSCGLRTNGTTACWGNNEDGQSNAPSGTFTAVTAGGFHSCGLRTNGAVVCWGYNRGGQASPPAGTFTAVTAGGFHSCGLRTDGQIVCWGTNDHQQSDPPSGVFTAVAAGEFHSCGLRTDGQIVCWGTNDHQQSDPPSGVFTAVAAGGRHSCGLSTNGTVACWGNDEYGQTNIPPGTYTTVTAGQTHNCALHTNRTITCWNFNLNGQTTTP